jgi:catechol-2,3-dioxygenase
LTAKFPLPLREGVRGRGDPLVAVEDLEDGVKAQARSGESMKKGIHHVGLAVKSEEEVTQFFEEVFGVERTGYSLETNDFFSRMIVLGRGLFELLEPRGEKG